MTASTLSTTSSRACPVDVATRRPPARYHCRETLEVQACTYDGTRLQALALSRWAEQVSGYACTSRAGSDGWTVEVDDSRADRITIHPGQVLVWTRTTRRWATCSLEQFSDWFEPAPRELPIFSDGETAE